MVAIQSGHAVEITITSDQPVDIVLCTGWTKFDTAEFEDKIKEALAAEGVDTRRVNVAVDESISTSAVVSDFSELLEEFEVLHGLYHPKLSNPSIIKKYGMFMPPGWNSGWSLVYPDDSGEWKESFMHGQISGMISKEPRDGTSTMEVDIASTGYKWICAPKLEIIDGRVYGYFLELGGSINFGEGCSDDPYVKLYRGDGHALTSLWYIPEWDEYKWTTSSYKPAQYNWYWAWDFGYIQRVSWEGISGIKFRPIASGPKIHRNCELSYDDMVTISPWTMVFPEHPLKMKFEQTEDEINVWHEDDLVFHYNIPTELQTNEGYCLWGFGYFYSLGMTNFKWACNNGNNLIDITRNPTYQRDSQKFCIDIHDRAREDFQDSKQIGELAQRFAENDLKYIGWVQDESRELAEKYLRLTENKGVLLDNRSPDIYKDTAKWIAEQLKKEESGNEILLLKDREYKFKVAGV